MRKFILWVVYFFLLTAPAFAQTGSPQTPSAMTTEINNNLPDNTVNGITPHILRQTLLDLMNSMAFSNGAVGSGGVTLYASPTGVDTNNNCMVSGSPCTLMGACNVRTQIATFLSGSFNINLTNGTYSAVDGNNALCSVFGNSGGSSSGLTRLIGTSTSGSPANTVLAVPAGDFGVLVKDGGEVVVSNVEFTGGNGASGIECSGQSAVADLNNLFWSTWGTSGNHISAATGCFVNVTSGGETLLANFTGVTHWNLSGIASFSAGGPTNIPVAVSWTGGDFLAASGNPYISLTSWTITGAGVGGSTGTRAALSGPGYMATPSNATCNATFPGDQNCSISNGFQDSAGDPTAAPSTIFSKLPGTIAGYYVTITDGKASNCGDSACTTWGTTVTGGGGALHLLLWANGTNYTLVGK
jgi:hypothetical protein